ncbi:MAG: hypothetical protein ABL921_02125 [Pirellula sp.]
MNELNMVETNNPVLLTRFVNEIEAVAILAALAECGIQGTTTGTFTTGFYTEAPGDVSVFVRSGDLPKALEVLSDVQASSTKIDWSNVDVGEPEDT